MQTLNNIKFMPDVEFKKSQDRRKQQVVDQKKALKSYT